MNKKLYNIFYLELCICLAAALRDMSSFWYGHEVHASVEMLVSTLKKDCFGIPGNQNPSTDFKER